MFVWSRLNVNVLFFELKRTNAAV